MTTITATARTLAAWRWERRKSSLIGPIVAGAALGFIGMAISYWVYRSEAAIFQEQGVTWEVVQLQGSHLPGILFIPAVLSVLAAVDAAAAQRCRAWQRARALCRAGELLRGQFLRNLERALVLLGSFEAVLMLTVVLLGFTASLPVALAVAAGRLVAATACGCALSCLITVAGLWVRDFALLASLGLVGAMASLAIDLVAPGVTNLQPFGALLPALTGGMTSLEDLTSPLNMAMWALWGCVWVGIAYGVGRARAARMEV